MYFDCGESRDWKPGELVDGSEVSPTFLEVYKEMAV